MFKGANAFYAVHNLWILTVTRGGALHSSGTTGVGGGDGGRDGGPRGVGPCLGFYLEPPRSFDLFHSINEASFENY